MESGNFYPRPPRGGRLFISSRLSPIRHFYPRPPRGGRRNTQEAADCPGAISIHVLREEDDYHRDASGLVPGISIHVLREEDDQPLPSAKTAPPRFLSTSSARRTTGAEQDGHIQVNFYPRPPRGGRRKNHDRRPKSHRISIHVLREEDDRRRSTSLQRWQNFYPRPPRGGRHYESARGGDAVVFLSTSSARRTTNPDNL